jgi:hypothetical protein
MEGDCSLLISRFFIVTGAAFALGAVIWISPGCSRAPVPVATPATPGSRVLDRSYMDLQGGSKLRIIVLLSGAVVSGAAGAQSTVESSQAQNQITVHTVGSFGYEQSRYAVDRKSSGKVRLVFESADVTKENKTTTEAKEPALPFPLPRSTEYIRLVYFVRKSQADHNMAILGAKRRDLLDGFTERLEQDPGVCADAKEIFCTFVPPMIAVRPE